MYEHKSRIADTLHHIEEAISTAPAEKQEEVQIFLEGYLAALEQEIRRRNQA